LVPGAVFEPAGALVSVLYVNMAFKHVVSQIDLVQT
jgi:hypothetical protein